MRLMRSCQEQREKEPIKSLSLSHGHPALGGREDRVGAAKETEKVQENGESRLSIDEENVAGKAGKGHSRKREQHRKGSETSVNEPYLERDGREGGETRVPSPSTPGRTGAGPMGVWAEREPTSRGPLCHLGQHSLGSESLLP